MAKKQNIETFEAMLRDVCSNETIFAGKVAVFGGDFRQVLHVSPRSTREECINNSLVESTLWPHLHIFRLTENIRALHDLQFSDFLLDIDNETYNNIDEDLITVPECMIISTKEGSKPILTLVEHIYPYFTENAFKSKYLTSRAILTPKNEFVDNINKVLMDKFLGSTNTYTSFDKATNDKQENYLQEFLHNLIPNGMPLHQLQLKQSCPIMLLKNIDPTVGICNGVQLICKALKPNVIHAEIKQFLEEGGDEGSSFENGSQPGRQLTPIPAISNPPTSDAIIMSPAEPNPEELVSTELNRVLATTELLAETRLRVELDADLDDLFN
ncbi:uncharacterized protein LOC114293229 [Camellia sinensis]|uniref:uncharacterized protein LOC114293229 n=1 Tax=Camellia sinensis TaxID=4442 RepID=UPI0010357246|nr:uncharacterized protein LOC114293229 [Camellia sinensis]